MKVHPKTLARFSGEVAHESQLAAPQINPIFSPTQRKGESRLCFIQHTGTYRSPVASLQFSADGGQLLAPERGHRALGNDSGHSNRVLEWLYDSSGPSWNLVPEITPAPAFKYHMGSAFGGQNAAGGVQPDCAEIIEQDV